MVNLEKDKLISLIEATQFCSYSRDYLNLRVRQGKLKGIKLGGNWFTTRNWIEEYIKKANEFKKELAEPTILNQLLSRVGSVLFRGALILVIFSVLSFGFFMTKGEFKAQLREVIDNSLASASSFFDSLETVSKNIVLFLIRPWQKEQLAIQPTPVPSPQNQKTETIRETLKVVRIEGSSNLEYINNLYKYLLSKITALEAKPVYGPTVVYGTPASGAALSSSLYADPWGIQVTGTGTFSSAISALSANITNNLTASRINLDNANTFLDSDNLGNMTFTDTVIGTWTLAQLVGGGGGGLGANLVSLTNDILSNNGTIVLGGMAPGVNNENLTFDFETTPNQVAIGTTTGVTTLSFNALNIVLTTGDVDLNGNYLIIDTDADTALRAYTDDIVSLDIGGAGTGEYLFSATQLDLANNNLTTTGSIFNGADNSKHYFGASNDDSLMHNGTNFVVSSEVGSHDFIFNQYSDIITGNANIDAGTGTVTASNFIISGGDIDLDGNYLIIDANGDTKMRAYTDDIVSLDIGGAGTGEYLFSATQLDLASNNLTTTGNIYVSSDSSKFYAGASNDLEIYHNGTNSVIDNNTGNLFLRAPTSSVISLNPDGNDTDFVFGGDSIQGGGAATDDYRFAFDKGTGAFRAGYSTGTFWYPENLGEASVAMGYNTLATGSGSFAMGYGNGLLKSTGQGSVAMGSSTGNLRATGTGSIAMGGAASVMDSANLISTASGSVAMGFVYDGTLQATGIGAIALGYASSGTLQATGDGSVAIGQNVQATQNNALAFGSSFINNTVNSFAVGFGQNDFTVLNAAVKIPRDNSKLYFGASDDDSFMHNGTNFVVSSEVGSHDFIFNQYSDIDAGSANFITTGTGTFGSATNVTQLIVKANVSQTNANPIIKIQKSTGADLLWISSDDNRNTFIGFNSGRVNDTSEEFMGIDNTFIGSSTGYSNTKGYYGTFIGWRAGYSNTEGASNTFIGVDTGFSNTIGYYNDFIGTDSGFHNTEGYFNTLIGSWTGNENTTGYYNTAVGSYAASSNKTGIYNLSVGAYAGYSALGSNNVFIGNYAGYYETGSNAFYIDNQDRTNTAGDKAKALLYGIFAAAAADQDLYVNADLFLKEDNRKLYFGASSDDSIIHNGTNLVFTSEVGSHDFIFNQYSDIDAGSANITTTGTISSGSTIIIDGSTNPGTIKESHGILALGGTGGSYNEDLSLNFEGANNTVIFSSSTGVGTLDFSAFSIATSGSETLGSLVVDTTTLVANVSGYTDKVGIGTASPVRTLEISSTPDIWQLRLGAGAVGSQYTYDIGRDTSTGFLNFYGNQTGYVGYVFRGADGTYMTILNNGNVGIGAVSPQEKLHIADAVKTVASNATALGGGNLMIEGTEAGKDITKGAAITFALPADTDGTNLWEQGRIIVTPGLGITGDAKGKMYLQTRNNPIGPWEWTNNLVLNYDGNVLLPNDNAKLYFGASSDDSFMHNGTNFVVSSEVGSHDFIFNQYSDIDAGSANLTTTGTGTFGFIASNGSLTATGGGIGTALANNITNTIIAHHDSDTLVALNISPTFDDNSYAYPNRVVQRLYPQFAGGSGAYPIYQQFLKPNGTNLMYDLWDSVNWHHYFGGNVYNNLYGYKITYDGNGSTSDIAIVGGARFTLDGTVANPNTTPVFLIGGYTYATAGVPLTDSLPFRMNAFAWNGADGVTLSSTLDWHYTQLTAANNSAQLTLKAQGSTAILTLTNAGNMALPQDNAKMLFGAANDASIYYDGTNMVVNPKEVGSGVLKVSSGAYFNGDPNPGDYPFPMFFFNGAGQPLSLYDAPIHFQTYGAGGSLWQTSFDMTGAWVLNWSSVSDNAGATKDLGLARYSAGVLKITNGSTGYGNLLFGDNAKTYYGTSSDDSIMHNGTNLVFTSEVGSHDFIFNQYSDIDAGSANLTTTGNASLTGTLPLITLGGADSNGYFAAINLPAADNTVYIGQNIYYNGSGFANPIGADPTSMIYMQTGDITFFTSPTASGLGSARFQVDRNGNTNLYSGNLTTTGIGTFGQQGIAAVSTDGLVLANNTASTVGAQVQNSQRLRFTGHGYDANYGGGDLTKNWILELQPGINGVNGIYNDLVFSENSSGSYNPFFILQKLTYGTNSGQFNVLIQNPTAEPAGVQLMFKTGSGLPYSGFFSMDGGGNMVFRANNNGIYFDSPAGNTIFRTGGSYLTAMLLGTDQTVYLPNDNQKLKFGAGYDASIYYDGSNMNFNSREVGTGDFVFSGGSVGIGRTDPPVSLAVRTGGASYPSGIIVTPFNDITGVSISGYYPMIGFNVYTDSSNVNRNIGAGYSAAIVSDPNLGGLYLQASASSYNAGDAATTPTAVRILANGNVGIGTVSPVSSLQIGPLYVADVNDVISKQTNIGSIQSQTPEVLLRLVRETDNSAYYPATVDFKVSAWGAGGGGAPQTKLTIGLKASYSYNLSADVDVMTLLNTGNVLLPNDSAKLIFGASSDDSIMHNGTNLVFTSEVGSHDFIFNQYSDIDAGSANFITTGRVSGGEFGIGSDLMLYNTGTRNLFLGVDAGNKSVTGSDIVAVGTNAVKNVTSGSNNFALGSGAMQSLTSGNWNVGIGVSALMSVGAASANVGIGQEALLDNTWGNNVAIGFTAGWGLYQGNDNVLIGTASGSTARFSGYYSNSVGIGSASLHALTSGSNNVAIGYSAGCLLTTGGSNVLLGYMAGYRQTTASNLLIIDNQQRASAAEETTNAIIYGVMAAAPANQDLYVNADLFLIADSRKLYFGASNDDSIMHNGTNLVFTSEVGSHDFLFDQYSDIDFGSANLTTTGKINIAYAASAPTLTTNGDMSIAYVNPDNRIYFYSNGGQHYITATAGFEIPSFETLDPISKEEMKVDDIVLGKLNYTVSDGALHGVWIKWSNIEKELIEKIKTTLTLEDILANPIDLEKENSGILAAFKNILAKLGLIIENGVAAVKTARIERIEMVDAATKEIYCTWIENGEWKKVKGECKENPKSEVPNPNEQSPSPTPNLEPTITPTPEPSINPEPSVNPEPENPTPPPEPETPPEPPAPPSEPPAPAPEVPPPAPAPEPPAPAPEAPPPAPVPDAAPSAGSGPAAPAE